MADVLHSVPIKASPKAVYKAITEPEGLRSWWTTDVEAEARQGSLAVIRFEGGQAQMRMRVKSLAPGKGVRWQVEDPSPPEWEGPEISWGYYLLSQVKYLEEGEGFPHDKPG
jgi:uncharacterized protein YndB with AHSA1/START domain